MKRKPLSLTAQKRNKELAETFARRFNPLLCDIPTTENERRKVMKLNAFVKEDWRTPIHRPQKESVTAYLNQLDKNGVLDVELQ